MSPDKKMNNILYTLDWYELYISLIKFFIKGDKSTLFSETIFLFSSKFLYSFISPFSSENRALSIQ